MLFSFLRCHVYVVSLSTMYVHEKNASKASKEFYSSRDMLGVLYIFGQGEMVDMHTTSRVRSSPDASGLGHATSTTGIG